MTDTLTAEEKKEIRNTQKNLIVGGDFTSPMSRLERERRSANSVLGKGPRESSDDGKSKSSSQSTVSTVPPFSQLSEPDEEEVKKMMTVRMTNIFDPVVRQAIASQHYPPPKKTAPCKPPKLKLKCTKQSTLSNFFKRT